MLLLCYNTVQRRPQRGKSIYQRPFHYLSWWAKETRRAFFFPLHLCSCSSSTRGLIGFEKPLCNLVLITLIFICFPNTHLGEKAVWETRLPLPSRAEKTSTHWFTCEILQQNQLLETFEKQAEFAGLNRIWKELFPWQSFQWRQSKRRKQITLAGTIDVNGAWERLRDCTCTEAYGYQFAGHMLHSPQGTGGLLD